MLYDLLEQDSTLVTKDCLLHTQQMPEMVCLFCEVLVTEKRTETLIVMFCCRDEQREHAKCQARYGLDAGHGSQAGFELVVSPPQSELVSMVTMEDLLMSSVVLEYMSRRQYHLTIVKSMLKHSLSYRMSRPIIFTGSEAVMQGDMAARLAVSQA